MQSTIAKLVVALTITIAGAVSAHEITLTDGFKPQFSVWLPNEWTVTMTQERITAVTEDGLLWCGIWDLENMPTLDDARKRIQTRAEEVFQNVAYDEPVELDLEGMNGGSIEGRGTMDGRDIVFFVIAFQHAKDRVGVVAFVGDPAVRRLYRTSIIDVIDSITANAAFYAGVESSSTQPDSDEN